MVKKNGRVSVNDLMKAVGKEEDKPMTWSNVRAENTETVVFTVRRTISLEEAGLFARAVAAASFSEDGDYMPEKTEFAKGMLMLLFYTNLTLPSDIEKVYALVYGTDLCTRVANAVSAAQITGIYAAADKLIELRISDAAGRANRALEETSVKVDNMMDTLGELFDGVSAEDIEKINAAIGENGIDAEKLMKAYVAEKYE